MLRKAIAKKIGISLLDTRKNLRVREYLNTYKNSLSWSKDEVENYQVKKIYELLEHAYKNVPFYKKRFDDSGFNYQEFKYLDQLKNIPFLTRTDIQNNSTELVSRNMDITLCSKGSSSGSTGVPVTYYHDANCTSASKAAIIFAKMLGGYKIGDKWINIWGNPTAVNVDWKKLSSKLSKFIFNEIRFPAYKLNDKNQFKRLLEIFINKKPKYIYGYTNAIYLFSEFLKENSQKLNFIKGVFTTAENLHDYQRKNIEEYLGKVFDQYGSSEINGVAAESLFDKYYSIISPNVFVEFNEGSGGTDAKPLIITSLHNKVMPFIRYENGDLATPLETNLSSFRLKFPKFRSIDGRVSDIVELPGGGRLVVPSFFGSRMLKNIKGIKQYQIIKKESDKISINLLTTSEFQDSYKEEILKTLKEYLPINLRYELVFNKEIYLSKNGKFKLFLDETK